ncbi:MAG: acetylornithine/succinylornithine family transaminase [Calditrichae bacterium]|nr:acetylornithine/succinylornithine family transaminase [Calditrichia bacterium]
MTDFKMLEDQFGPGCYPMRDVVITRGQGSVVYDENGREYIDCVAGQGVVNVGHCNPYVVQEIKQQAETLITCSGTFYNDTRSLLMEKINEITPPELSNIFLCNSGAEAVEAALKMSRIASGKTDIIAAMRAFHGRTFGALSATFNKKYKKEFEPLVPGFDHVPYNNFEKLAETVTDKTAAVILEMIQGEGGVNVADENYVRQVRQLCNKKNILLIIDEVQTGFCRTGKMFAFEHYGVVPDILCLAKAMAGGLPIGAIVFPEKLKFAQGNHGSTFGGNPISAAAALGAISYMQDTKLAEQAAEKGAYMMQKLQAINSDKIRQVRGKGLLIGIELKEKVQPYILAMMDEGVLTLPSGSTVLRLLPTLVISCEQMDTVVERIEKVLQ